MSKSRKRLSTLLGDIINALVRNKLMKQKPLSEASEKIISIEDADPKIF